MTSYNRVLVICSQSFLLLVEARNNLSPPFYFTDYTTFLTIPVGAKSIQIKELRSSSSFIAVKSRSRYYLNGDWSMDWPGKFYFAGSKFVYNRLYSGLETLYSTGPTNETLEIQVNTMINNVLRQSSMFPSQNRVFPGLNVQIDTVSTSVS